MCFSNRSRPLLVLVATNNRVDSNTVSAWKRFIRMVGACLQPNSEGFFHETNVKKSLVQKWCHFQIIQNWHPTAHYMDGKGYGSIQRAARRFFYVASSRGNIIVIFEKSMSLPLP
jgi:hypothetical protein